MDMLKTVLKRWRRPKLFVSYRRDDSAVHAHSIHAELVAAFGADKVFFDVKAVEYGAAFAPEIEHSLSECDVLVIVIGPQWLSLADPGGKPRLDASNDYVRHEIATSLRADKRIIPVYVGGATLALKSSLPAEISALADLNALFLTDRQIGEGARPLIDAIRKPVPPVVRWLQLRARLLALISAVCMSFAAWLSLFDFFALDTKTSSATLWLANIVAPMPLSPELKTIVIDEATQAALGKSFTGNFAARREHAALIKQLTKAGARSIAFDIFLTRPSPADDQELIEAIRTAHAANTIVSFGVNNFQGETPDMVPAIFEASPTWSILCVGTQLGLVTSLVLASQSNSPGTSHARALGLALVIASRGAAPRHAKFNEKTGLINADAGDGPSEYSFSKIEPLSDTEECQPGIKGDKVAFALYRQPTLVALRSSALQTKYESIRNLTDDELSKQFRGKTVLVGSTFSTDDVHQLFNGWEIEDRHGLELHAAGASALLQNAIIRPLGFAGAFVSMLALGLIGGILAQWAPQGLRWPSRGALLIVLMLFISGAIFACISRGLLVNLTYPLGALFLAYWAVGKFGQMRGLNAQAPIP
jgi:CHASE2 domain-containing sensor protein